MIDISLISYFAKENNYEISNKAFKIIEEILAVRELPKSVYRKGAVRALEYLRRGVVEFEYITEE